MRDEAGKGGQPQTGGIVQICLDFQLFSSGQELFCSVLFFTASLTVAKMKNSNHFLFFFFNLPKIF